MNPCATYAVFHSPEYRRRYAEFLKIDFPRLPLTSSLELFRALARLGGELVALHLLESPILDSVAADVSPLKSASQPVRKSPPPENQSRLTSAATIPKVEFIGGRNPEVERVSFTRSAAVPAAGSAGVPARRRSDGGTPPELAGEDACATGTVWINKAQSIGFHGVPENVWNFHIGGYQVCQKWLKDRTGRTLTKDDLAHYHKIVIALSETIRLMAEIDAVIEKAGGWPLK